MSQLPLDLLNAREQERLLHALTCALDLCELDGLRRWARGPLQALLPHRVLTCVRLGSDGEPLRIECVDAGAPQPSVHAALSDPAQGLAMAAYRLWRQRGTALPLHEDGDARPDPIPRRLAALGLANALAHGTPTLPGGSTFFLLAGLPQRPAPHHVHLLCLLLPHLHLALQRVCVAPGTALAVPRALSPRETQVLRWLREGKSNDEIGIILGISGLTVKNHLQRLYKLLGASNRAHAVARSDGLAGLERRRGPSFVPPRRQPATNPRQTARPASPTMDVRNRAFPTYRFSTYFQIWTLPLVAWPAITKCVKFAQPLGVVSIKTLPRAPGCNACIKKLSKP